MLRTSVVVIGGGATGVGVLRDLALRGVPAILVEQGDLAHGTSSRFHGLLHSGARYAVKDPRSARECIRENAVLRRIGRHCVEDGEGYFVRLVGEDEGFEARWVEACAEVGILVHPIDVAEARRLEPHLTGRVRAVYRVPDAAIDGFRLVLHNARSALRHGAGLLTYTEVTGIDHQGGAVRGVSLRDRRTGAARRIACELVVNAAGSWVGRVARLAEVDVPVTPDRGTLVTFNHRFTNRVINRLRPPADGDIFVPHGSVTILGTTSAVASGPEDTAPLGAEVLRLVEIGKEVFERLPEVRILRAFSGTRPLLGGGAGGREAPRSFALVEHDRDGLAGMVSLVGGKLTTYRLMAEVATDAVCRRLGVNAACRTAEEPILEEPAPEDLAEARRRLPSHVAEVTVSRVLPALGAVVRRLRDDPEQGELVCECEMVTRAEVAEAIADEHTHGPDDVRRRTRMGMGTCQGSFCAFRSIGLSLEGVLPEDGEPLERLREFLQGRWRGIRPALWGNQLREIQLTRAIYAATLGIDGGRA